MQLRFRKHDVFPLVGLFLAILAGRWLIAQTSDRAEIGERTAAVCFEPVTLDPRGFAPLRLAGAWSVSVDDPRFGGISGLAVDSAGLLALTDAGVLVRLPKPGDGKVAEVRELPGGPGRPGFKRHRDSEALLRDPSGSGWWVAFENRHSLWRFDAGFGRALGNIDLGGRGWRANSGVEGIASAGDRLLLFSEPAAEMLIVREGGVQSVPFGNSRSRIADSATLPDGRVMLLQRQPTLLGFRNRLAWLESGGTYSVDSQVALGVGPFDNMEALTAEPTGAGVRLWLMSDNDFRGAQRTLLLALDLSTGR